MKIKILFAILLLPISFINYSCNKLPQVTTTVRKVTLPAFGNVDFELTHKQFVAAGFNYDDLVEVIFHDYDGTKRDMSYEVAYVTNYNEVGYYCPCLCNYENKSDHFDFAFGMSHLKENSTRLIGKKVTIKMKKKKGYAKIRKLVNVSKKLTYEELSGDNLAFSNFRDVTMVGEISDTMIPKRLYRGSSPYNSHDNPEGRHDVVDKFLAYYNIQTEIALSGSDEQIAEQMKKRKEENPTSHTWNLYQDSIGVSEFDRKFYSKDLGTDYFTLRANSNEGEKGGDLTREIFTYISRRCGGPANPSPIYIHCNEGKDRTGFFVMVLEALAGIPLSDIVRDFMLTFKNYYNVSLVNDADKYNELANLTIYRHVYSILINDPADNLEKVQWYHFDAKKEVENILGDDPLKLQASARNYLENTIHVSGSDVNNIQLFLINAQ